MIAKRRMIEAAAWLAKAFEIFLIAAGGERRQRAAMEGALERDDAPALGPAR